VNDAGHREHPRCSRLQRGFAPRFGRSDRAGFAVSRQSSSATRIVSVVRPGRPTEQIRTIAREIGASLIVLGAHERHGLRRCWLRGKVATRLVASEPDAPMDRPFPFLAEYENSRPPGAHPSVTGAGLVADVRPTAELHLVRRDGERYLPRCAAWAVSGSYVLSGTKLWCTNGTPSLVVMARTLPSGGISAFVVGHRPARHRGPAPLPLHGLAGVGQRRARLS
jgi:hypothetical protein